MLTSERIRKIGAVFKPGIPLHDEIHKTILLAIWALKHAKPALNITRDVQRLMDEGKPVPGEFWRLEISKALAVFPKQDGEVK